VDRLLPQRLARGGRLTPVGRPEVLAIRYASHLSKRSQSFLNFHLYAEPDTEVAVDSFFWVIRDRDRVTVVDTGFAPEAGRSRGRTVRRTPADALPALGIDPAAVCVVVVTHAHYDHIGNLHQFPNAEFVIARAEYDFWAGPLASRRQFAEFVEPAEIARLRSLLRAGRLTLISGHHELAGGIELTQVGGHTPGQLIVGVDTPAGRVVLASDALHFYEELHLDRPFSLVADLPGMYRAYDLLAGLAARPRTWLVAGHDPQVRDRFMTEGDVTRLSDPRG
jgi:glyoxylase-like metal-dependent hydrolase (beta-lactamase superfamily II)